MSLNKKIDDKNIEIDDNESIEDELDDTEIINDDNDNDNDDDEYEDDDIPAVNDTELLEDKEDIENCYFQYDNLIDEYEELGQPQRVPDEDRITLNKLTKYEMVRVLGIRAKQISVGAKTLVKNIEDKKPIEIALFELKNKTMPFKIKRPLPNNTYEIWKISELNINITENDEANIKTSFLA